jgi:hypothetical protein
MISYVQAPECNRIEVTFVNRRGNQRTETRGGKKRNPSAHERNRNEAWYLGEIRVFAVDLRSQGRTRHKEARALVNQMWQAYGPPSAKVIGCTCEDDS